MAKRIIPKEDTARAIKCGPDPDKAKDEFINGDCICTCQECGIKFIGNKDSYFCPSCINEYF